MFERSLTIFCDWFTSEQVGHFVAQGGLKKLKQNWLTLQGFCDKLYTLESTLLAIDAKA
jgi:hypothetical protein